VYRYPPSRSFQEYGEGEKERHPGNETAARSGKGVRPTPVVDPNRVARRCWQCHATDHLARDRLQDGKSRPPTQSVDQNLFVRRCWRRQSTNHLKVGGGYDFNLSTAFVSGYLKNVEEFW